MKMLGGKVGSQTPRGEDHQELPSEFPFDPEASYEDFEVAPKTDVTKPECIKSLDFEVLPDYETSSEEDDDEE
jgi:hypothetical protein